jgi:hypothetical protein
MRRLVLVATCLVAWGLSLAQSPATIKQPLGAVTGIVIQEPSGAPLGKVLVSLSSTSEGIIFDGNWRQRSNALAALTELDGHFRIDAIPSGEYRVELNRNGFVPQRRRSSRRSSTLISVSSGQTTSDLRLAMQPACAITGKVVDEDGDAISGVSIMAKSRRSGSVYGSGVSDDLGEFRIAGLRKREYVLLARSQLILPSNGASGQRAYLPTYYPGTMDINEAAPVDMRPGDEAKLALVLISSRVFRARGTVSGLPLAAGRENSDARASGFSLSLQPAGNTASEMQSTAIQQDGTFEIAGLLPGSYRVTMQGQGASGWESVSLQPRIEIQNSDADGLELAPVPNGEVRGHFSVEGTEKTDWSQFSILLKSVRDENSSGMLFSETAKDGSFAIKNIAPDDYEVIVNTTTPSLFDYIVKDLRLDGKIDADWTLHVTSGIHTIEVLLNAHGANIQGTLLDESKQPLPDAQVICIPEASDRKRLADYHQVTTDQRGRFNIQGLTAGEYMVFGLDDYVDDITSPEFLEQHNTSGLAVKVDEGQHKEILLDVTHVE